MEPVVDQLINHEEACIRYKVRIGILGEKADSPALTALQQEIACSPRVAKLLSERFPDGKIPHHPYQKWRGAHWILVILADVGYPKGDENLVSLREQVLSWLLSPEHTKKIPTINGLVRRCASQESNALYALLSLGFVDERTDELARRLVLWQWPDGGWNCDKNPEAHHSSFWESWIPLRALALHARLTGNIASQEAADRAAELFLRHSLYKRESDQEVMNTEFTGLHYPWYWRYDILAGLKVMQESGHLNDPRCQDALHRLESMQLPDGGFRATKRFYRVTNKLDTGTSLVDWGPVGVHGRNDFVTVEALIVLTAARKDQPVEMLSSPSR